MGARTSGREATLQMLYAVEAAGHAPSRAIADFWREFPGDAEGRPYADELLKKIWTERERLDKEITRATDNWRIERMTRVDRNILRLGACELLFFPEVPSPVIIDESVELAKRYGSETSTQFVNGVLNKLANLGRGPGGPLESP